MSKYILVGEESLFWGEGSNLIWWRFSLTRGGFGVLGVGKGNGWQGRERVEEGIEKDNQDCFTTVPRANLALSLQCSFNTWCLRAHFWCELSRPPLSHLLLCFYVHFCLFLLLCTPGNSEGKAEVVKFKSIQYFVTLFFQSENITFSTLVPMVIYLHR